MNRRATVLLSAFVIAFVCAAIVYITYGKAVASAHKPTGQRVVVAAGDIKLGTILSANDLKVAEIESLPNGAIEEKNLKNTIGRGVISDLYRGEPILESRLAAVGSGGGLAAAIPQGMRACAVRVDEVVGVSGFVTPGMHVDVIVSGTPPGVTDANDGTQVRTLLQNLKVLSAGTDFQKDAEGKAKQVQVVNLLVTPEDAETLSLASNQTRIQLVLRNPLDAQVGHLPGNGVGNLFAGGKPRPHVVVTENKAVKKQAPEDYTVEVYNGSKGSVQSLGTSEGKK
jgi:pilus assembly protein CpaB